MRLKALLVKRNKSSVFKSQSVKNSDARKNNPSANELPLTGKDDFWMVMMFILLGWGLWAGKEVRELTIDNEVAIAEQVALSNEFSLESLTHIATSEEALKWINLLQSFDDNELDTQGLLKKYENLSMAAAILSASSSGPIRQRFWSARAVKHSERAVAILSESDDMLPAEKVEEVNTRLLMAMGLNYLQNGEVHSEDVTSQFQNIDQEYLQHHGFCRNKLLRALAEREVIELPNYYTEINI